MNSEILRERSLRRLPIHINIRNVKKVGLPTTQGVGTKPLSRSLHPALWDKAHYLGPQLICDILLSIQNSYVDVYGRLPDERKAK